MVTIEDCLAFSGLNEDEVAAIALHRHLPDICAVELAAYLRQRRDAPQQARATIGDEIDVARARGDLARVPTLKLALAQLMQEDAGASVQRRADQVRAA